MWTQFMDMYSGGGTKTDYEYIYIEGNYEDAVKVFEDKFNQDPLDVACSCCGQNFSISENGSIEEVTGYERGCRYDKDDKKYIDGPDESRYWAKYISLREYKKKESVLFIEKSK